MHFCFKTGRLCYTQIALCVEIFVAVNFSSVAAVRLAWNAFCYILKPGVNSTESIADLAAAVVVLDVTLFVILRPCHCVRSVVCMKFLCVLGRSFAKDARPTQRQVENVENAGLQAR